jgi:tetratricopeptide (TPR) repeat protein
MIAAKIMETETDNLLRSEILYAESQDEILAKLDQLSKKIRRQLGESRYRIAAQDKPLAKVTTSSLEALKQYSLGIERHWLVDYTGAKRYYENSLRIDSGFIAAKASLGNLLIQQFDPAKGRELLNQAVKSVDNLTDREKYGILAFHAASVEEDYTKAIENTRFLSRLYPDDYVFYNNLGWYYQQAKKYEDALTEYKKAIKLNPKLPLTYSAILWIYEGYMARPDSSIIWAERMISDNPQSAWGYCYLGSAWFCLDSIMLAQQYFMKAREIDPYLSFNLYRLAHTFRIMGLHKEAIRILEKIPEINKDEVAAYLDIGRNYQTMGNQEEARKYISIFKNIATKEWLKQWPDDAATYISIGSAYALSGDMDSSRQMLQKAISIDSTKYFDFATVLCLQGNIPESIDQIEKALESGYRNLTWLKMNPDLEKLRFDIRFRNLLQKYFK